MRLGKAEEWLGKASVMGDLWVTWVNLTEGGSDRGTVGAEALRECT